MILQGVASQEYMVVYVYIHEEQFIRSYSMHFTVRESLNTQTKWNVSGTLPVIKVTSLHAAIED